jgi:glycosyltransferase involved in cell wall biosynthesis/predicted metal-dependent phosphoesterase TrpH
MTSKADLHVHSQYSEHPSEWFLQRLGAAESYTEPEAVYRQAKAAGMDWVTITDHNNIDGSLLLRERHPLDTFTGVEATAYFPGDGCKVHVLVWGLTAHHYDHIQRERKDVYGLSAYLRGAGLAHAVAHATYDVNHRLSVRHLERLILLFDVFEGLNGGRHALHNREWTRILQALGPAQIEDLRRRHRLEPASETPWVKGLTGGSDDHGGLFAGRAHTVAEGEGMDAFLESVRAKRSEPAGRSSDFKALAFTVYKVAYDFSKTKAGSAAGTLLDQLAASLFERKSLSFQSRWKVARLRLLGKGREDGLQSAWLDLVDQVKAGTGAPVADRLERLYPGLTRVSDEFLKALLSSAERHVKEGDLAGMVRNIAGALPGIFLCVPFFTTLRHLFQGRELLEAAGRALRVPAGGGGKRILWFTDTLTDLNGVGVTLQGILRAAEARGMDLRLVTSLGGPLPAGLPSARVEDLPAIHAFPLPYYERYILRVPSVLGALDRLQASEADVVFISTPGPVGLLGLLYARLLNVPAVGFYHTDFTLQARAITGDESLLATLEAGLRWFYGAVDEVRVATPHYARLLRERGYRTDRVALFPHGLDTGLFAPREGASKRLRHRTGLPAGFTLLYAGRISEDKGIGFLLQVYRELARRLPAVNLILAGDGPDLEEFRRKVGGLPRVHFAGRLPWEDLPEWYSAADAFVFPSTTDTFGMVVAEAMACGTPALVSDRGGPQDLVEHARTGYILPAGDLKAWVGTLLDMERMEVERPEAMAAMRQAARDRAVERCGWDRALAELCEPKRIPPFRLWPDPPDPENDPKPEQDPEEAAAWAHWPFPRMVPVP